MIIVGGRVNICDNSGAYSGKCVGVLRSGRYASIGGIIVISVRYPAGSLKKRVLVSGRLQRALVLNQCAPYRRANTNILLVGSSNSVCLLNNFNLPLANRVRTYVFYELRTVCYKVLSLSDINL